MPAAGTVNSEENISAQKRHDIKVCRSGEEIELPSSVLTFCGVLKKKKAVEDFASENMKCVW